MSPPLPPKEETGPNPAVKEKKVLLNCLKVTIVEFVKKKKILLAPVCCEKNIPLHENSRPPPLI